MPELCPHKSYGQRFRYILVHRLDAGDRDFRINHPRHRISTQAVLLQRINWLAATAQRKVALFCYLSLYAFTHNWERSRLRRGRGSSTFDLNIIDQLDVGWDVS